MRLWRVSASMAAGFQAKSAPFKRLHQHLMAFSLRLTLYTAHCGQSGEKGEVLVVGVLGTDPELVEVLVRLLLGQDLETSCAELRETGVAPQVVVLPLAEHRRTAARTLGG